MSFASVKDLMEEHTDFKVDRKFINKVLMFVQTFQNKNDEHTNFFGGHLMGVYRPVWGDQYESMYWLQEICGIFDIEQAQDDVYELKDVDRNWRVASNLTNISFLYVAHRIYNSGLPQKEKEIGIIYTIIAAHMKHLTSGMRKRFRFRANESIAMAHFESLDYRSDLKKAGSWFDLLRMRGEQVIGPKFLWQKQLATFQGTYDIVKWTNDLQDRLTDVLNTLTESFHKIKDQEAKISSFSRIGEYEGIKEVGSYRNMQREIIEDLKNKMTRRDDFIKEALIADTDSVLSTLDARYLRQTLDYLVENNRVLRTDLDKLAESITVLIFEIAKTESIPLTQPSLLYGKLRDLFRSARTKREDIIGIKYLCKTLVEEAIPRARMPIQTSTAIGLYTYIILRIFTIR
ncbi:hypothetical protein [Vibrio phage vB_VmeM-Yong XC32]|nr:hypothetical protein [Vibrio phage vB_VmeM-Yong XC31]QAX96418.1 hypothetical protein [Vibrio phage vB_VmeM-Yong XC32]QAX96735.1 hypothetical protein [Vibrio phage vB_VmeM-Yong MS31]QAX97054.1 hypothetical protein [Vibrio phage vB_VmeM-Yong MS32]